MQWINIKKEHPPKDGPYIFHAETADEEKPLIGMAWYNPEKGWSLLLPHWIDSITHWMEPPKPPKGE